MPGQSSQRHQENTGLVSSEQTSRLPARVRRRLSVQPALAVNDSSSQDTQSH